MSAKITVQQDKMDHEVLHLYIKHPKYGFYSHLASINVDHLRDLMPPDDAAALKYMSREDFRDFDVELSMSFADEEAPEPA